MGENANVIRDVIKHGMVTAVGIIVTYFVTAAVEKKEYKKDDTEKEKQRLESLEKTSLMLNNYISRYDSLHDKYIALVGRTANNSGGDGETRYDNFREAAPVNTASVASSVTGDWVTPDGTVGWRFDNGRVQISGIGSYIGFFEAAGSYSASGETVSGTVTVSKLYYADYRENLRFNFRLSDDRMVLYGNSIDGAGNTNVISLNRY